MLTARKIEEMNKTEKLDPNYKYYLEDLHDGFSVICVKSTTVYEKDAVICCKRTAICKKILKGIEK